MADSGLRPSVKDALILVVSSAGGFIIADDWIGALSAAVLWFIWTYLRHEGGLPVLAAALTFQWAQVTIGIWYYGLTGRQIDTMVLSDYRPMVLIGLGCVGALAIGLRLGISFMQRNPIPDAPPPRPLGWLGLIVSYIVTTASEGAIVQIAYEWPGLTQAILALEFVRLGIVFLIARRLAVPVLRWQWMALLISLEVALGITGFFAGFRDPLVMTAMVIYESFDARKLQHWLMAASLFVLMVVLSTMWMSVRREYRASFEDEAFAASRPKQLDKMRTLARGWLSEERDPIETDRVVDRLWTVYYPALAISRVPSVLPHTDGALMMAALQHVVTPRIFFPTKADLPSDSEMVRKYSGVFVAGVEQNTSIAFGYAGESYIDFGIPLMFVPVFIYALLLGAVFEFLVRRVTHPDLRAGLLAVVFWMTLYLFERSWVMNLGLAGTLLIYLGGPALLLDYYLSRADHRLSSDHGEQDDGVEVPASL